MPRLLLKEVSDFASASGRVDTKGLSKKEITRWQCELVRALFYCRQNRTYSLRRYTYVAKTCKYSFDDR